MPGSFICSGLCRTFDAALWINPRSYCVLFCDPEPSAPAAASVVGAVMVVLVGAAALLLLLLCYRR